MQETINHEQARAIVQPATSSDIIYRAYGRSYDGGGTQVITLLASCSHSISGYKFFFVRQYGPDEVYTLMEQLPGVFFHMLTYYVADYTSGMGLTNPVASVTIIDAHGKHTVPVENM